jgi:guanylate kinase
LSERLPNLFVVAAPSGTGKSTLLGRVMTASSGLRFSVSHTTRTPRVGETDGVEYHFVSRPAFDALIAEGAFLEWADVHGERYGTARSELARAARDGVDLLLDLDVQGAAQVRNALPDAVTVFLLPPSFEALEERLRGRGKDSEATIRRRLQGARVELARFAEFDYLMLNDDLEACVASLEAVIRAARSRCSRVAAVAQAVLATFPSEEKTSP